MLITPSLRPLPSTMTEPKPGVPAGKLSGRSKRGSVEKYLSLARRLANDYDVDEYIKGRLDLLVRELDQLFNEKERSTQLELTDFAPV